MVPLLILLLVLILGCGGDGGDQLTGPGPGALHLTTTTTGTPLDPDGYRVTIDGGEMVSIGTNASLTIDALAPGTHSVLLSELSPECAVSGENPRTLTIAAGSTTETTFSVSCEPGGAAAGQLAFTTDRDGNDEIYLLNADGTGLQRLTSNPAADLQPTWAPDGSKLAFSSNRSGNYDIYVMDANGENVINLTHRTGDDFLPAWSPDGSKIAFVHDEGSVLFTTEIYVMDTDGGNQVNLTNNPDFAAAPEWSPDGTKLAFESDRDFEINFTEFTFEIFVMNANGGEVVNITNNDANDEFPSWSPDGSRIAFHTDRTGNLEIFLMDPAGGALVNLTNHPAADFGAAWSPDGTRIAFSSSRYRGERHEDLLLMAPDGTRLVRLTAGDGSARFAAWRP